ncbi:potassium transporter [Virgisporangium aliadipatigenens]|uniref:Potassium transporter n=1 Tax=Virgisporangium aliadipatigenens TaxID=741659 RepID=A0A8J3YS28_9ACTN|nr:cation:proton antiporter [Virgisporangium aliadipatigenens]GIJ49462.1 potassium transporter [Virgisporangium aliadipatigenens]
MHFFLQMAVVLATYRLLWPLFRRLGQVQVVAIMVAGFVLGPSLLGAIAPDVQEWIFPAKASVAGTQVVHPNLAALYVTGQLGLVLYMFIVGMGFNVGIFADHLRHAAVTSFAGIAAPMILGGAVGYLMWTNGLFPDKMANWQAALFVAAAVAITAFPMLAWIVYDSGLLHTRLGTMALACAAADDAAAWILLAAVVASTAGSPAVALLALFGGLAYLLVMVTAGRALLRRVGEWAAPRIAADGTIPPAALLIVMLVLLAGAWVTDRVGIYAVFGAFIAGTVMPRGALTEALRDRLEPLTAYVLLPAFFVYSGLNTRLTLLFDPTVLAMLALVLVVSFVGKGVSVGLAARIQGMSWREAGSLGSLMNARGLMELILLNIGLNAGVVSPEIYTVLAVMAIVTTFAATPMYRWIASGHTFDAHGVRAPVAKSPEPVASPA